MYHGIYIFTKNSPLFETADTSLGSDIQDIPGNIIGYLHEKSDVIRVRIGAAAAHIIFSQLPVFLGGVCIMIVFIEREGRACQYGLQQSEIDFD